MAACSTGLHLLLVPLLLTCVHLSVSKAPCDPLIPGYCLLPFPSSYYLEPNTSTKTGYRVHFPIESFPRDSFGRQVNPEHWNTFGETYMMYVSLISCQTQRIANHTEQMWVMSKYEHLSSTSDGFTPFPSILAYFANLSSSNLPHHWNISESLSPTSPTVLLNADTGLFHAVCTRKFIIPSSIPVLLVISALDHLFCALE